MALNITPVTEGSSLTLKLEGKLSTIEAKAFDAAFQEAAKGKKEVLLDFSAVDYISSAGLRSLFLAKRVMIGQGGELKVLYPTTEVMEVFQATRYDNVVTIVQREQEQGEPVFYPLRPVQRMMVDTHFQKAESTMMNAGALLRLDDSVDLERLADAFNGILSSYDIFRARLVFHPETGDICQRFDGEVEQVTVEILSDEAFEQRRQELKEPYELIDRPLYRAFIMQTPSAKYIYADFYHAMLDGTALTLLFWREVDKRYLNGNDSIKRKPASYAEYILEESKIPEAELAEGRAYWKGMLAGFDKAKHLPPMDGGNPENGSEYEIEIPMEGIDKNYFKGKEFNETTFFLGASMLATAHLTGAKDSVMTWVHNGRMTSSERRLMGLMLEQFPIRWDFSGEQSVGDFLQALEKKLAEGIKYRKGMDVIYDEGLEGECGCFILQKGTMGRRGGTKFCGAEAVIEELPANEISAAENVLDIEMNAHDDGTYSLVLLHDPDCYSMASMKAYAREVNEVIKAMQEEGRMVSELLKR